MHDIQTLGLCSQKLHAGFSEARSGALAELARPSFMVRDHQEYSRNELETLSYAGFYRDTTTHLIVSDNGVPIAWIGFDLIERGAEVTLTIAQIQGAKVGKPLFKKWPHFLVTMLMKSVLDQIHAVEVLPARLNPYWQRVDLLPYKARFCPEVVREHQKRLTYYYDVIPRVLGFAVAPKTAVADAARGARSYIYHTFPLHHT